MPIETLNQYTELAGELNLNLGCGSRILRGPGKWVNVDGWNEEADIVYNIMSSGFLTSVEEYTDDKFDFVLASHVLEHVTRDWMPFVLDDIWTLLKPGGTLLAITPHGRSDDAWENPHHLMSFTETTWFYFSPSLYSNPDSVGYKAHQGMALHPWAIDVALVPWEEHKERAEEMGFVKFREWSKQYCNVWREVHAIMRKPKEAVWR